MRWTAVNIELENTSGRKQRLRAWNYHDDQTYFVDNVSATRINRRALEESLANWKKSQYAQLPAWEYIAKIMPDWQIVVTTKLGTPIWTNAPETGERASAS